MGNMVLRNTLTQTDLRPFRWIPLVLDDEDVARVRVRVLAEILFRRKITREFKSPRIG